MTAWFERLLPPTSPSISGIPKAILQAALCGIIIGPFLGVFFGWSGPIRAAMIGATYCVVYYTLCAMPSGYARRCFIKESAAKHGKSVVLTNFVGAAAAYFLISGIFEGTPFLVQGFRVQSLQIWIVLIMLALGWGYLVSSRESAEAETRLENARTHTRMLQSRMNPHFFFNTLNTISALIPEDQAAAQRMLGLMADMSRYVFTSVDTEVVPLVQELDFARAYVEIEKVRFGTRLRCVLPDDSIAEGCGIPVFTLQPLIENAVRHGIGKRVGGGAIVVRVARNRNRFSLTVENDIEDSVDARTDFFKRGHALDNIRERLRIIYGGQALMEVACSQNMIRVKIEAPAKPEQSGTGNS